MLFRSAQQLGPPVARPCVWCISHFSTRGVRIFLVSPPLAGRAYTYGVMMDIRIRASRTAVVRLDTIYVCSRAGIPPQSRPPLGDGGTEHGGLMVASDWHHLRAATSDVMHQFWIAMRRAKELAPDVIAHPRWAFADSPTDELFRIRIELIAGSPGSARVCEARGALSMSEPPLSKVAQQMARSRTLCARLALALYIARPQGATSSSEGKIMADQKNSRGAIYRCTRAQD